jgi:hypothetical protein
MVTPCFPTFISESVNALGGSDVLMDFDAFSDSCKKSELELGRFLPEIDLLGD